MGTKPTVYADDLSKRTDGALIWNSDMNSALRSILPTRCSECWGLGDSKERTATTTSGMEYTTWICDQCEGRGWLYPEAPAGSGMVLVVEFGYRMSWECIVRSVWRAMGIWEGTE